MIWTIIPIYLNIWLVGSSSYNEDYKNCEAEGGSVIDQDLCFPNDYKKAVIPWTEDSKTFQINVSIILISLVEVSIERNSFSFYYSTYGKWRDPRYYYY